MSRFLIKVPMGVPLWNSQELKTILFNVLNRQKHAEDKIKELEHSICSNLGVEFCIATDLGRQAILLAIKAMGLSNGDGIILPSFLCSSALIPILKSGCLPQFVDIGDDLNLDPQNIIKQITPKTRAILMPHLFGKTAKIGQIVKIAHDYNLFLIDDVAQSLGAKYEGKYAGTFGDVGILSFGPFKALTATRGGALVTNNEIIYRKAMNIPIPLSSEISAIDRAIKSFIKFRFRKYSLNLLSKYGQSSKNSDLKIENDSNVSDFEIKRISGLDASLALCQLKKMLDMTERRKKNANALFSLLKNVPEINFQTNDMGDHVFTKFIIKLNPCKNDELVDNNLIASFRSYMRNLGIEAQGTYVPLHLQKMFLKYNNNNDNKLSYTESNWHRLVSVPLNPQMKKSDIEYLASCVKGHVINYF